MPLTTNSYHKRLTATELLTFDDIVTDALVDCVSLSSIKILKMVLIAFKVHYWTKIRKNRDSLSLSLTFVHDEQDIPTPLR